MKKTFKVLSFIFAVVLLVAFGCVAAFAVEPDSGLVWELSNANGIVGTYATLQEAVDNSYTGTGSNADESVPHTITLLADTTGKGAMIAGKEYGYGCADDLTIDLNGHTYTVNEGYRKSDSKPIDDKGIRVAYLNSFVMKNGTVNVAADAHQDLLALFDAIQGNGYVELNNVVLDGTNLPKGNTSDYFVVRVGSGAVILSGEKSGVKAAEGNTAMYVTQLYGADTNSDPVEILIDDAAAVEGTVYVADSNIKDAEIEIITKTGEIPAEQFGYASEDAKATVSAGKLAAEMNGEYYISLADAIAAANDGDVIVLSDGVHRWNAGSKIVNKTITFEGGKDAVIDMTDIATDQNTSGATLIFNGLTVKFGTANYRGFQHTAKVVYNACTLEGQQTMYAPIVEFTGCTFKVEGNAYAVWTYGAKDVTFSDCVFNTDGKAVLVYAEAATKAEINLTECEFNSTGLAATDKAAVEVGASAGSNVSDYDLNFTDCKADDNFVANKTDSNLWGNKNNIGTASGSTVVIDEVLQPMYVVEFDGKLYATIQEAIDLCTDSTKVIKLLDSTIEAGINVAADKAVTIDLNGKTVYGYFYINGIATIKNGAIDASTLRKSAVEINSSEALDGTKGEYAPELTLEGITAISNRHALRIDGGKATIESGSYTAIYGVDVTGYAVNASSGAQVTINDGVFQSNKEGVSEGTYVIGSRNPGTVVTINGGTFSRCTGTTLAVSDSGAIVVTAGLFDQEPTADVLADKKVVVAQDDGMYKVVDAVAQIDDTFYASIADAMLAAQDGNVVKLLQDFTGAGFDLAWRNADTVPAAYITLDLGGFTYTVNAPVTGKIGIQNGYGNKLTIQNGTINIAAGTVIDALVRTYDDLTLKNVTLDGTNLYAESASSWCTVVVAYNGDVAVLEETNLTANPLVGTAVWLSGNDDYGADKLGLVLNTNGTIKGNILQKNDAVNAKGEATATVEILAVGTFEGAVTGSAAHVVTGAADALAAAGFGAVIDKGGEYLAYKTLADAVAAAPDNASSTILVLADYEGPGFEIRGTNRDLIIDFNSHTYTFTKGGTGGAWWAGIFTYAYIDNGYQANNITMKNGTLNCAESNTQVYTLIRSYSNLTLLDMYLDATNAKGIEQGYQWGVGTIFGELNIIGNTSIVSPGSAVAVYISAGDGADYPSGGNGYIDTTGTIEGDIFYGNQNNYYGQPVASSLKIESIGAFDGELHVQAEVCLDVVDKTGSIPAPDGYVWVEGVLTTGAAKIGDTYYATLADAVTAANDGDTIYVIADSSGSGMVIDKSITIDFQGHVYTITGNLVASGEIKDQGFQLLKDNDIVFEKGTIVIARGVQARFLIQNYANLTLDNMALDGENLYDPDRVEYVLSINYGKVLIQNSGIAAPVPQTGEKSYAFDVCKPSYGYAGETRVTVIDSEVYGDIELAGGTAGDRYLTIENIDLMGTISGSGVNVQIYRGNFDYGVDVAYIADGSVLAPPISGSDVLRVRTESEVLDEGFYAIANKAAYVTLAEAFAGAEAVGYSEINIKLLGSHYGAGIVTKDGQTVNIDFNGFGYVINSAVGSAGTITSGFQLLEGSKVTLVSTKLYGENDYYWGILTSEAGSNVKFLIQNYADLTIEYMILEGEYLDEPEKGGSNYTLSINNGNVTMNNAVIFADTDADDFAFDVYASANYPDNKTVTLTGCVIGGNAELAADDGVVNPADKMTLTLNNSYFEEGYGLVNNIKMPVDCVFGDEEVGLKVEGLSFFTTIEDYNLDDDGNLFWQIAPADFNGETATMTFYINWLEEVLGTSLNKVLVLQTRDADNNGLNEMYAYHTEAVDGKLIIKNSIGYSTFTLIPLEENEDGSIKSIVKLNPGESLTYFKADGTTNTISTPTNAEGNHDDLAAEYYADYDRYAFGKIWYETLDAWKVYGTEVWFDMNDGSLDGTGSYEFNTYKEKFWFSVAGDNSKNHFVPTPATRTTDGVNNFLYENVVSDGKHYLNFTIIHVSTTSVYTIDQSNFIIDDSGAGTIIIKQAPIGSNYGEYNGVLEYNGEAQTGEYPEKPDFYFTTISKANDGPINVKYSTTAPADPADHTCYSTDVPTVTNVSDGTLTVYYIAYDEGYGNYAPYYGSYTIKIKAISLAEADFELDFEGDYILTYNGEEQTVAIKILEIEEDSVTLVYNDKMYRLVEGVDYTVSGNTATNVGTYEFTITGIGNFCETAVREWQIVPAKAQISIVTPDAITYGDEEPTYTWVADGLFEGDTLPGFTIEGEYDVTVPELRAANATGYAVYFVIDPDATRNPNYDYDFDEETEVKLVVNKKFISAAEMTLKYTAPVYYGDTELFLENFLLTFAEGALEYTDVIDLDLLRQKDYLYSPDFNGGYNKKVDPIVRHQAGAPIAGYFYGDRVDAAGLYPNYDFDNKFASGNPNTDDFLQISKRPVTVKPLLKDDVNVFYGHTFMWDDFTYEITSTLTVVDDDVLNLLYEVLNYEAGSSVGDYTIQATDDGNPNYEVSFENGTAAVAPRKLTVGPNAHTVIYGQAYQQNANPWAFFMHDPAGDWTEIVSKDLDALNALLTTTTDYLVGDDVGRKTISIAYANDTITAADHPNYELIMDETAWLFILPETNVDPDFEATFIKMVFDGMIWQPKLAEENGLIVTMHDFKDDGVVGGDVIDLSMVEIAEATEYHAGTYEIQLTITGGNYEGAVLNAHYTIHAMPIKDAVWTIGTYTYNGEKQGPSAVAYGPQGIVLNLVTTQDILVGNYWSYVEDIAEDGHIIPEGSDIEFAPTDYVLDLLSIRVASYEIDEAIAVKFDSAFVAIGNTYAMNFIIPALALEQYGYTEADADKIFKVMYNDTTKLYENGDYTLTLEGDEYILTYSQIAPSNMSKDVIVTPLFGKTPKTIEYSIADYCYDMIEIYDRLAKVDENTNEANLYYDFIKMIASLLNYGDAAETYATAVKSTLLDDVILYAGVADYDAFLAKYGITPAADPEEGATPPTPPTTVFKYNSEEMRDALSADLSFSQGSAPSITLTYNMPAGMTAADLKIGFIDMDAQTTVFKAADDTNSMTFTIPLSDANHTFVIGILDANTNATYMMVEVHLGHFGSGNTADMNARMSDFADALATYLEWIPA